VLLDHIGRLALEPARAIVRAGVLGIVGLAGDVQPELFEHRPVRLGLVSERRQEVPHHHAVDAGLHREPLELAEVLHASAAEAEERAGKDQAEDRDPLDRLPRIHVFAVAELRSRAGVEHVDRHARRVDGGQLEGHLDTLLPRLTEVEDSPHARLQPGLAHRLDGAQAPLVADGAGDLVVVARGGLDVVVHSLDAGLPERGGPFGGHVADRRAALQVGVLRDQPHAIEVLLEVALGEPLSLGDHAEAMRARGLGGSGMLEDLIGLHHRVHRRLGLGEARLGAEAAVLGTAAGLGVHQRAHVGGVCEPLHPRLPGTLHECFDLGVILDLA